jgi:hypothetical protein
VVEQLTHILKVEASNPATAGTKIEKIARKKCLITQAPCVNFIKVFLVYFTPLVAKPE